MLDTESPGKNAETEYDELDGFESEDDDPNIFKIRDSLKPAKAQAYTAKELHGKFSLQRMIAAVDGVQNKYTKG